MDRGVMSGGAMGLNQMGFSRSGAMQRVRRIQRRSAKNAKTCQNQCRNQAKCANARNLHSINILSTMGLVPCLCPWAAHFVLIGHCAGCCEGSPRMELTLPDIRPARCDIGHWPVDLLHTNTLAKKQHVRRAILQQIPVISGAILHYTALADE